jgi:hypothetical protein
VQHHRLLCWWRAVRLCCWGQSSDTGWDASAGGWFAAVDYSCRCACGDTQEQVADSRQTAVVVTAVMSAGLGSCEPAAVVSTAMLLTT